MSTPAPDPDETSKMKKILNAGNGGMNDSIKARLPHGIGVQPPLVASRSVKTVPPPESPSNTPRWKFLPAFWTIASLMSITVNIIMIAVILILLQMLGAMRGLANDKASGLLAELYTNFAKMDQATISRSIPVDANIPINFPVSVNLFDPRNEPKRAEKITLASDVTITNAHVIINQPSVKIDAPATVVLRSGTELNVYLDSFDVPVQSNIPIHLDVPVNIPLNETALHEPFVGLRNIVQPYYCMVQPKALLMDGRTCP